MEVAVGDIAELVGVSEGKIVPFMDEFLGHCFVADDAGVMSGRCEFGLDVVRVFVELDSTVWVCPEKRMLIFFECHPPVGL